MTEKGYTAMLKYARSFPKLVKILDSCFLLERRFIKLTSNSKRVRIYVERSNQIILNDLGKAGVTIVDRCHI